MQRHDELLREASRLCSSGGKKAKGAHIGGEVALYLAERANTLRKLAAQEMFEEVKTRVTAQRLTTRDQRTIDLHGLTSQEAVDIVKETLAAIDPSPSTARPLKIITGRGSHSVQRKSVLKPAVKSELVSQGWSVTVFEGGLYVTGRAR
ncbi:hypothetical protein FISHEDRAFT_34122 [Fistulina hepatica ATCC 64428]|uniref:Smr domain-containing protein n=1 Tax=Fistulina hepatica ATCC 64428 TaxID=1128425 RepID=A0A0D7ANV9_9AGAR|nr:hypothetical protein FISHEDRAFT_34122 [Fistulina hepatica ATCC 64428]